MKKTKGQKRNEKLSWSKLTSSFYIQWKKIIVLFYLFKQLLSSDATFQHELNITNEIYKARL